MTKYTDNDHYEIDKARVVAKLSRHLHNKSIIHSESVFTNDILDLLNQSKWIGADSSIIFNNQPVNQPCTLLKNVDTTTVPN